MDVDALTRKKVRKERKHEAHKSGSADPLYFRGFPGEIRSVDTWTRDSIWGLTETQSVVEPQYVPPMPAVEAPLEAPQAATSILETRPHVSAK
jgi:hypothetical protein